MRMVRIVFMPPTTRARRRDSAWGDVEGNPYKVEGWSRSCWAAAGSSARTRSGCCARCSSAGSCPSLVVGTSVGAINGAAVATEPSVEAVAAARRDVVGHRAQRRVRRARCCGGSATLARTGTHLHGNDALRATLTEALPIALIEDLPVRFQCVAASIEAASEHWFASGPIVDAVLASAAVPGILPPVEVGGEHFIDGGIVNSIPVNRAVELGATRIFVMHVGRVDRPLEPPRWPWEVALVAFEIARRHRFLGDLAALPDSVEVHVHADRPARAAPSTTTSRRCATASRPTWGRASSAPTPRRWRTSRSAGCDARPPRSSGASLIAPLVARRRARADRRRAVARGAIAALAVAALRRPPPAPRARARARLRDRPRRRRRRRARRCGRPGAPAAHGPHYAVLRWFVGGVARDGAAGRARARDGPRVRARRGGAGRAERPLVVLSIHSGEGDSLLVLDHLLRRHRRRPRIVMHEALALDPLIDVIGKRLPNRFVDPRGGDTEVEIAAMSRDLGGARRGADLPRGRQRHRRAAAARDRAARCTAATTSRPSTRSEMRAPRRAAARRHARRAGERAGRRRRLLRPPRLPGLDGRRRGASCRTRRRSTSSCGSSARTSCPRATTRGSTGCSTGGRRSTRGSGKIFARAMSFRGGWRLYGRDVHHAPQPLRRSRKPR